MDSGQSPSSNGSTSAVRTRISGLVNEGQLGSLHDPERTNRTVR